MKTRRKVRRIYLGGEGQKSVAWRLWRESRIGWFMLSHDGCERWMGDTLDAVYDKLEIVAGNYGYCWRRPQPTRTADLVSCGSGI